MHSRGKVFITLDVKYLLKCAVLFTIACCVTGLSLNWADVKAHNTHVKLNLLRLYCVCFKNVYIRLHFIPCTYSISCIWNLNFADVAKCYVQLVIWQYFFNNLTKLKIGK